MTATGFCACASLWQAAAAPQLHVSTSWIGNTFGFGDGKWVQINITAIAVTPDGTVYTDAPWDESGAEISAYQNGNVLGFAGGTHGWGGSGGNAVAVNSHYLYAAVGVGNERGKLQASGIWPPKGRQWYGVTRRPLDGPKRAAAFRTLADPHNPHASLADAFLKTDDTPAGRKPDADAGVGGLAASDALLYVSNTTMNRIEVYDAQSMQRKTQWSAHEPGRLALARDGTLWALVDTLTGRAPRVVHYASDGRVLADSIPLPDGADPVDIALDPAGRLLIADNGPRQQVLIYARGAQGYTLAATLGEQGGIFSGVAGRPGPRRFNGLTGVGCDAHGNIYVSTNGIGPRDDTPIGAGLGATLESYAPSGHRRWVLQGLLFVDGAWMDPARPDSVYTGNKRFDLDLSRPPGKDWKYAGFLSDRFRYPEDPVFLTDEWPGLPTARALDGHTFLYLTDMYADHLKIYRFDPQHDGEIAIPSGFIAGRARPVKRIPNAPPGGDWIWRDKNGNGAFDAGEFERNPGREPLAGGWGWWIDTHGDIWRARDSRPIARFRFGGLDARGNPIYSYAHVSTYPVPAPFTDVHRVIYEPDTDTLYVAGYTADAPHPPGFPKEAGRVFARYDHWSSGTPQMRYRLSLPWDPEAKPPRTPAGLTVEGRYVFVVEPAGIVHVYDKDTAQEIGTFGPTARVGYASGWVDVPFGISAHRMADGEYLVFVEEDARGKVLMYRWKPA